MRSGTLPRRNRLASPMPLFPTTSRSAWRLSVTSSKSSAGSWVAISASASTPPRVAASSEYRTRLSAIGLVRRGGPHAQTTTSRARRRLARRMAASRAVVAVIEPSVPTTIVRYPIAPRSATGKGTRGRRGRARRRGGDLERPRHVVVHVAAKEVRAGRKGRDPVVHDPRTVEDRPDEQRLLGRAVHVDGHVVRDPRVVIVKHDAEGFRCRRPQRLRVELAVLRGHFDHRYTGGDGNRRGSRGDPEGGLEHHQVQDGQEAD